MTLCELLVCICESGNQEVDVSPNVHNFMQTMNSEVRRDLVKQFVDYLVRKTCICFMHIGTGSLNSARPPLIVPCLEISKRSPLSLCAWHVSLFTKQYIILGTSHATLRPTCIGLVWLWVGILHLTIILAIAGRLSLNR